MAPVSGAIFLRQAADFTNVCDKSARTAVHGNYGFASWHIAYKNESIALLNEKGAHWGTALRYRDRQPIGDGTWVCPMTSLCYAWQIRNWPKGADAAPTGPFYNSNL